MGQNSSNCFKTNQQKQKSSICSIHVKAWRNSLFPGRPRSLTDFKLQPHIIHQTFGNIEKDITRTFPSATSKLNLDNFREVLRKLAVFFPHIGYTQGMNFIAGFFLLCGLDPEDSFSICVRILTHYDLLWMGLFEDEFPLNRFYCALVWAVVDRKNQLIRNKISALGMTDQLWMFQWFTTLFIYSLPSQIIPDMWTFLFVHREFSCVRIASSLILNLWPEIEKCQNQLDFLNLMTQLKICKSFNKLLKSQNLFDLAFNISKQQVERLLPELESVDPTNKYLQYFLLDENNRKLRYVSIIKQLGEERQRFLKDSKGYKFDRIESQIEVIDSIQMSQAMMLSQSLHLNMSMTQSIINEKLWRSDMYRVMADESKKCIPDLQLSASVFQLAKYKV